MGGFIELAEIEGSVGIIDVGQGGQSMQTRDDLLKEFEPFTSRRLMPDLGISPALVPSRAFYRRVSLRQRCP